MWKQSSVAERQLSGQAEKFRRRFESDRTTPVISSVRRRKDFPGSIVACADSLSFPARRKRVPIWFRRELNHGREIVLDRPCPMGPDRPGAGGPCDFGERPSSAPTAG